MDMGTQGAGRKRLPNRERLTAEDDALNQIAREVRPAARYAEQRGRRAAVRRGAPVRASSGAWAGAGPGGTSAARRGPSGPGDRSRTPTPPPAPDSPRLLPPWRRAELGRRPWREVARPGGLAGEGGEHPSLLCCIVGVL